MIKNVIFDIGNVILNFNVEEVLKKFTDRQEEQKFIMENIIKSPEWLEYALIDTGYISREEAIDIVSDRTNHSNDELIKNFWYNYNNYAFVNTEILDLIKELKSKGYNVYLLSNINSYTTENVARSGLFELVDGYILSYQVHQVKPYEGIYKTLLEKYNLTASECLFIDDNQKNIVTGNKLGILSKKVEPDNVASVIETIKELNLL